MKLSREQIEKYLGRIGMTMPEKIIPDSQLLSEIQYAHSTTVPYENLDILRGVPISLRPEDLYEKIVENGRGGYCFELNGLLGVLLENLGYEVTDCFARYLRGESQIPMRRHRVLKVKAIDGVFTCDAGTGEACPRTPLRLIEGLVQNSCGEQYRYSREPGLGWLLMDHIHGEWKPFYSFEEFCVLPVDFTAADFYCQYSEDSPFNKKEMFSLKTKDGRITLDGNIFKRIRDEKVIQCIEYDKERIAEAYAQFGIRY